MKRKDQKILTTYKPLSLAMTQKNIDKKLADIEYSIFNNDFIHENDFKQRKRSEIDVRRRNKKTSKSKTKKRTSSKEDGEISQKYKGIRMTSPTSEKTDAININTEGDVLDAMAKRQTTFLTPFESEKGRNKKSRSQQKTTKKSHTRCKSGMTKLSRRNNLNRSVIETNKHKAPNSIENRGPSNTSHSMNHGKIDKIIRENLKKQKEMELAKEIEELHIKEGMLLK